MDPFIQYAVAAADWPAEDAVVPRALSTGDRCGSYVGSGIGGIGTIEEWHSVLMEKGPAGSPVLSHLDDHQRGLGPDLDPLPGPRAQLGHGHGLRHRDARRRRFVRVVISRGDAEVMIAGGAEAADHSARGRRVLRHEGALERNDEPERASRPFDARRDGFVIGEGAGIVVLEELGHALRRGATIYAEVVGYGMTERRLPPRRPGRGRGRRGAGHAPGARRRRRLRRPRSTTSTPTAPRPRSTTGSRRRRSRAVFGEHAREARRQFDQVHDRPPPRRGRRHRGGDHRPLSRHQIMTADDQLRKPRSRLRPGLRAERGPPGRDRLRPVQFVRLRRDERRAALPAFRRLNRRADGRRVRRLD